MTSLIHPSSSISKSVKLGENVKIGPFCNIDGNITIGNANTSQITFNAESGTFEDTYMWAGKCNIPDASYERFINYQKP